MQRALQKGEEYPALEQITVAVGTGQYTAEEAAGLYDQDVQKAAQQLGLPGWE